MDQSRICLIQIIFNTDNYTFFKQGKVGINLEDLKNVLVCNASDLRPPVSSDLRHL